MYFYIQCIIISARVICNCFLADIKTMPCHANSNTAYTSAYQERNGSRLLIEGVEIPCIQISKHVLVA